MRELLLAILLLAPVQPQQQTPNGAIAGQIRSDTVTPAQIRVVPSKRKIQRPLPQAPQQLSA